MFFSFFLFSFFWVFPKVVVCFLWYFGFSRRFFWFCKNLRENPKKTYPRVGLKPLETLFVCLFLMFVLFSLVFFGIFGFLEGCFGFVETFGKTKKTQIYPRVSLKPLKTLFFWCSLVFFCIFGFL